MSRYQIMDKSAVIDPEDGNNYPDPLSVDWGTFTHWENPIRKEMSWTDVHRPDILCCQFYQQVRDEYSDIVFSLNFIPHRDMIDLRGEKDAVLILPSQKSLEMFIESRQRMMQRGIDGAE